MKLKLKVSKTLKKELKILAGKNEIDRIEMITEELDKLLQENQTVWSDILEGYPELLIKRKEGLEVLKASFTEETPITEQRQLLKTYYTENHLYVNIYHKKKKYENIMLSLSDEMYYGICIMGENKNLSVEHYVVDLLKALVKQS